MKDDLIKAAKNVQNLEIGTSKKLDLLKKEIASCITIGYTHAMIVSFLKEGGVHIERQVFSNYLARRAKGKPKKQGVVDVKPSNMEKPKQSSGFEISKNGLDKYS